MKRFYKQVAVAPGPEGYTIALDGRPVRTPARHVLTLPTPALAQAVAAEWQAQGESLDVPGMHLTRLSNQAQDRVAADADMVVAQLCNYAATDLLCYRAAGPASLVERQAAHWDPLLEWAAAHYGVLLPVTVGVMPQPPSADHAAVFQQRLAAEDAFRLTGLAEVVVASGSLVIGLAVLEGRLAAAAAWGAASVDECFQAERWGPDAEAQAMLRSRQASLEAGAKLLALARPLAKSSPR
ncbi:MAG: ATPase [Sphingomonadales bacterium]